jgi:hypothetical protein
MKVYLVKKGGDDGGWLYKDSSVGHFGEPGERALALVVHLSEASAREAAEEDGARVAKTDAETITEGLEDGRLDFVRVALGDGEPDQLCRLEGWRALLGHVEEELRAVRMAQLREVLEEAVARGEAEYDLETDTYRRLK